METAEFGEHVRALLKDGSVDQATTLVLERHAREILGFIVGITGDVAQAGDAFSFFSEDVWRGLPRFQWRSSLRTWLFTLARRATARYLRTAKLGPVGNVALSAAPQLQQVVDGIRTRTRPYLRTEAKKGLARLKDALTGEEQMLLNLRHDKKLPWREIALILLRDADSHDDNGVTRKMNALKQQYGRLLPKLTRLAQEEGLLEIADE